MKIVMIADDSPVIRKVGRRLMEDMGFVVVEAADGHDAIERCRSNMPDAVIIDRDMPGPPGVEVVMEIARMPAAEHTKILYCVSEMMIPEMTRAKRSGACSFIMKPFSRALLEAKFVEVGLVHSPEAA